MYSLGIDAGTSGLKALVVDASGAIAGQATATYTLRTPRTGWVEADPEEWWDALCNATRQALQAAGIAPSRVGGIGFSGQMHTLVLLDQDARPVRPAICWADTRGSAERAEIEACVGRERLIAWTGNAAVTAFTATKLLWVRRHEPDIWARARLALLPKDYLRLRLTGVVRTDPSDAGATGLLDLYARDWSVPLLALLDLPRALLPEIAESTARAGAVTPRAAEETGLLAGTPVAIGAGDQECAALGCGVTDPGPLLITLGTGGQVFAATATPLIDPHGRIHAFPHAVPNRWHVQAAIPAAGLALSWLRTLLCPAEAAPLRPTASPPIFTPDIAGQRTPSMDDQARAIFFGLALDHTRDDLLFAGYEGVAFALRACVDVLVDLGVHGEPTLVTGGLAGDRAFLELLSDVLGRSLMEAPHREGSAYGAALLGAWVSGSPLPETSGVAGAIVRPRADRTAWHAQRYETYRQLSSLSRLR